MRRAVLQGLHAGRTRAQLARELGQTQTTIGKYRKLALDASIARAAEKRMSPDPPRPRRALPSGPAQQGEVLDSPDVAHLKRECLRLRKAMLGFDDIGLLLGISERKAREYANAAIAALEASENLGADLERRLMIEQLDQMIQAIHPLSTGRDLSGASRPIVLEAVDRMLKLMKQKADLLGISNPPAVDLRIRLQALAADGGYDIVDLEDLAREVISAHKIKVPEFR